jgi:hypothetical protein
MSPSRVARSRHASQPAGSVGNPGESRIDVLRGTVRDDAGDGIAWLGCLESVIHTRTRVDVPVFPKEFLIQPGGGILTFLFDVRRRPHVPTSEVVALQA